MVTHILHLVGRYAERVAFIRRPGRLDVGDLADQFRAEHLEELYGIPVVVGQLAGKPAVAPARNPTSDEGPALPAERSAS